MKWSLRITNFDNNGPKVKQKSSGGRVISTTIEIYTKFHCQHEILRVYSVVCCIRRDSRTCNRLIY